MMSLAERREEPSHPLLPGRSKARAGGDALPGQGLAQRRHPSPETGTSSRGLRGKPGQAGKAGRAREGAAWRDLREQAASSMFGAEEVCTGPEQERELPATCSGGPSGGSEAKARKSRSSRSSRAGLLFPVSRVDRQLRRGLFAERFGARAPVYLAAVLQCVTHEVMDVAGMICKKSKQKRISPSHLQMALQKCAGLKQLPRGAAVPRRRRRAAPQSPRVASPSKKNTTKSKKRCPRQRAAPARATAAVN
ncbi:uncharacterized protein LOC141737599 [Larus michahellis]